MRSEDIEELENAHSALIKLVSFLLHYAPSKCSISQTFRCICPAPIWGPGKLSANPSCAVVSQ